MRYEVDKRGECRFVPCQLEAPKDPEVVSIKLSDVFPAYREEQHMNKYTVSAREISSVTFYEVEALSEEDAISMVENGDVEADEREFEEIQDVEVTDVEYGEVEFSADLRVDFVVRGVKNMDNVRDALWDILAGFDGKTIGFDGDGELELTGFNVDSMTER